MYSSKLRLSRRVLRMERRAALILSTFLNNPSPTEFSELTSGLEWLLTWKLKTARTPDFLWCDGVDEIILKRTGKYKFQIIAKAWIGPEANVEIISKKSLTGALELSPSGKAFKSYNFKLNYNSQMITLKKR